MRQPMSLQVIPGQSPGVEDAEATPNWHLEEPLTLQPSWGLALLSLPWLQLQGSLWPFPAIDTISQDTFHGKKFTEPKPGANPTSDVNLSWS